MNKQQQFLPQRAMSRAAAPDYSSTHSHELVESVSNTMLIVTCIIGNQQYGLPILGVREVVRLPALLEIAGSPPFLSGLLNFRGQYVPVLNGRVLMGDASSYELSNQIIIAGHREPEIGLLVDRVLDVHRIPSKGWTTLHQHTAAAFLHGVVTLDGSTSVILFDLDALRALVPDNMAVE